MTITTTSDLFPGIVKRTVSINDKIVMVKEILDCVKTDVRHFKCEEILKNLESESVLTEIQQILLNSLKKCKEDLGDFESKVFLPKKDLGMFKSPILDKYFEGSRYLDWDCTPMKMWEWSFKKEYLPAHVGEDFIKGWRISTVWLGLNHGWGNEIQIFETMIFKAGTEKKECDFIDMYQERYSHYDHALERHKEICEMITNDLFDELKKYMEDED